MRAGRIPLLELHRAQVDRLFRQVALLELENDRLRNQCLTLWLAIQRIGGLNDSPSHFNPDIDLVIARLIDDPELDAGRPT